MSNIAASNEEMMDLARKIAANSRHSARPNPWVGAVVLTPTGEVATGATDVPGKGHAEAIALGKLGDRAKGATMWVTLEPCAHWGRTPPCTERIIAAGIERVVISVGDPDIKVNGLGIKALRDSGIEVLCGVGARDTIEELLPYLVSRSFARPFVTLKLAMTLDGFIAAPDHSSKWITGPLARERVQEIRADHDAIVVGAGTIRYDNPRLDVRLSDRTRSPISPRRIVLGSIDQGAAVLPADAWAGAITELLGKLRAQGVISVMVEGGATVAHSFLWESLVDQFHLFIAPKLLGGSQGVRLFEGMGAASIAEAIDMKLSASRTHGQDTELVLVSSRLAKLKESLVDRNA